MTQWASEMISAWVRGVASFGKPWAIRLALQHAEIVEIANARQPLPTGNKEE